MTKPILAVGNEVEPGLWECELSAEDMAGEVVSVIVCRHIPAEHRFETPTGVLVLERQRPSPCAQCGAVFADGRWARV